MRRLLRLQHHKHTGKLLPAHHTSYPILALFLLLLGGLIVRVDWSMRHSASADDLFVSARIAAPIPTSPAVITHPADGTTTDNPGLTVSGTCPVESPAVSVAIYRGTTLLASAPCVDGSFSVEVTLLPGANTLIAKTLTITGDYGPDSTPVTVIYTPASVSGNTTEEESPPSETGTAQGLLITSRKPFILFGPFTDAEWVGNISGGQPPYTVTIDWGDGTVDTYDNLGAQDYTFSHHYKKMQSYSVHIRATDIAGARASATYAANTPYVAAPSLIAPYTDHGISPFVPIAVYCGYLSLISFTGALWLQAHHIGYTATRLALAHTTTGQPKARTIPRKRR